MKSISSSSNGNRKINHRMKRTISMKCRYALGILKNLVVNPKRIVDPAKSYYPECPHKSKVRIVLDQLGYVMRHGEVMRYKYGSGEYYIYGLDVKGTDPSDYITEGYNMKRLWSLSHRNPLGDYVVTLCDKCLFAVIMHDNNMPIPTTYGMIKDGQLRLQGGWANAVPMETILQNDCLLLCKPNRGNGGRGIIKIQVSGGKIFRKGEELSLAQFTEMVSGDTFLVQHFVENQHEAMKRLYPDVLNTLRVTMVRTDKGIELMGVMCLMGSAGSEYSNWHFGGICISVDENGRLRKYGFSNSEKKITKHPNTGVEFEGYQIPFYKETIDLCKKAMDVFYGLKTIGWDMAITEDGPIFIEGNHGWGVAAHQMVDQCGWAEKYHRLLG